MHKLWVVGVDVVIVRRIGRARLEPCVQRTGKRGRWTKERRSGDKTVGEGAERSEAQSSVIDKENGCGGGSDACLCLAYRSAGDGGQEKCTKSENFQH